VPAVIYIGRFHPFYRPRRPLGLVDVKLYSFLGPRHTRWGWEVQPHAPAAFTPGRDLVPNLQEAGWAPGPVWTGGKSRLHRDSIPGRPSRSQSLYRVSYPPPPTHTHTYVYTYIHTYIHAHTYIQTCIHTYIYT